MNKINHHIQTDNCAKRNKLEYLSNDKVFLDLPIILTPDKTLNVGMPYLKLEGQHTEAVKLLSVCDEDNVVYLKIQNIKTGKINTISWSLDYCGGFWLWSLASLDYIVTLTFKLYV